MKQGFLSQYFEGIAVKRLSSVEVDPLRSNQHEFNGSRPLRNLFGDDRLEDYPIHFVWLGGENEGISADSSVTWYDAREHHPTRTEFRLYFKNNPVIDVSREGDLLIVAKRSDKSIYIIVVEAGSTLENQLLWLFGVSEQIGFSFNFQQIEDSHDLEVDFAVRYILEEMGIEVEEPDDTDYLDRLLEPYFNRGFPSTAEFSTLARKMRGQVSPIEDPDHTLIQWMENEEKLFKRLERHIVSKRLEDGFLRDDSADVDGFIEFSLKVQNRRKSRVGYALENHLEEIFKVNNLQYSRNKVTENKSRPDFIFPTIERYRDLDFPTSNLTMLGVKSTCKDRWRQVLSEAARIQVKHLLTLEPGISENQTSEMQSSNLHLVLPKRLHETYKQPQQAWLLNLQDFLMVVKNRQIG